MDPSRYHLMDTHLTLDPDIAQKIAEIEAEMMGRRVINLWLQPNWMDPQSDFQRMLLMPPPAPLPNPWSKPGKGPDTPKPGEMTDVLKAVYQLPAVQNIVTQAHDEGLRQVRLLKRSWDQGSTSDKVAMVSLSGLVVGSSLTMILANKPTRSMAFDLIKGKDIPVPKVEGLSFRILDKGGGVSTNLGVPGLRGSANFQTDGKYDVNVTFDVMTFIRSK